MVRGLASINWLVGCLTLAAAIGYPFYHQVMVDKAKSAAAAALDRMVQSERLYSLAANGAFVYFPVSKPEVIKGTLRVALSGTETDFVYDAYSDREHPLVVRAMSSDAAVRTGRLPPLLYSYAVSDAADLPKEGRQAQGEWQKLSGKSVGLLAALGM